MVDIIISQSVEHVFGLQFAMTKKACLDCHNTSPDHRLGFEFPVTI
jgi:hypothetical protein